MADVHTWNIEVVAGNATIISIAKPDVFTPNVEFRIIPTLRNDGTSDTLFVKLINVDTGVVLDEQEIVVSAGRNWTPYLDVTLTQTTDFHGNIEVGHTENGVKIVDDSELVTIPVYSPPPPPLGAIGCISPQSTYYTGPFNPGAEEYIMSVLYGNRDDAGEGIIHYNLYEHPNTPSENLLQANQRTMYPGQTETWYQLWTIPNISGPWPLGIKVWGDGETEPTWALGARTGQAVMWNQQFEISNWIIPVAVVGGLLLGGYFLCRKR